jgi:hypothetical protein
MKYACLLVSLACAAAGADVNLEFRPVDATIAVGDTAQIGLFATWDGTGAGQTVSALQLAFAWDNTFLDLTGLDGTGGATLITSEFPAAGSGGLNEAAIPGDGDAFYLALADLGVPIDTTVAGGALVTTFLFEGLAQTPGTLVDMLVLGGFPPVETRVFDGVTPNTIVTGTLSATTITIVPAPGAGCILVLCAAAAPRRRRA